jgi:hypothetical protein
MAKGVNGLGVADLEKLWIVAFQLRISDVIARPVALSVNRVNSRLVELELKKKARRPMEFSHLMIIVGAVLVVLGMVGFAFSEDSA